MLGHGSNQSCSACYASLCRACPASYHHQRQSIVLPLMADIRETEPIRATLRRVFAGVDISNDYKRIIGPGPTMAEALCFCGLMGANKGHNIVMSPRSATLPIRRSLNMQHIHCQLPFCASSSTTHLLSFHLSFCVQSKFMRLPEPSSDLPKVRRNSEGCSRFGDFKKKADATLQLLWRQHVLNLLPHS
ncbi:hypothetical protein BJ508DRAFT_97747 [Ascobolus immersus RN42]|uniref:Uncharacterized protein n=1 Tax=Ascobolus immersus RN42 TaxID=1160509 RepID=A0A3N4IMA8_ASCIM|nr:hypothetical protein BJ508DRAFT_97747 [Ascobolus immersus RN42]